MPYGNNKKMEETRKSKKRRNRRGKYGKRAAAALLAACVITGSLPADVCSEWMSGIQQDVETSQWESRTETGQWENGTEPGEETGGMENGTEQEEETGGMENGTEQGGETGGTENGTEQEEETGGMENGTEQGGETGGTENGTEQGGETGGTENGTEQGGETGGPENGTEQEEETGGTENGTLPEWGNENSENDGGMEDESGTEAGMPEETTQWPEEPLTETAEENPEEETMLCTCGSLSQDPWEHEEQCQVFRGELQKICDCGSGSLDIWEHGEDCAVFRYYMKTEELDEAEMEEMMALTNLTPSGTPVAGAPGWTKASPSTRFSSDYYPVRFYGGVSSLQTFNSSSHVTEVFDQFHRFYPVKGGEGGKFGAIYKKVLYQNNQWYDLKMTVMSYTTSVRADGGEVLESYPFIEFHGERIGWNFNDSMGAVVIKCEYLENKSGVPARVNTRFQWWDVDGAQRFGVKTADGSISGRYYYEGSRLYCQSSQTVAGVSGLDVIAGWAENASGADVTCCVTYELKQCSAYYMSIGIRDHIDNDDYSMSPNTLKKLNEELASGAFSGNRGYLQQTDTSMSMIQTPSPQKSVSNDGVSWGEQNTLPAISSEYWYRLEQFVPWQDAKAYYESFTVKDVLPEGVDYAGEIRVIRIEDGKDVTGWFTISSDRDVIAATAKNETRSAAEFYGYHYRFLIKAKLDPEEMEAGYSGNKLQYTVKNGASVVVRHFGDSQYTEASSNTVTTLAWVERREQPSPVKGFDGKREQKKKILRMKGDSITYSIFQEVPENDRAFYPVQIEMRDKLEACLQCTQIRIKLHKEMESGQSQAEDITAKWDAELSGEDIRISGPYQESYGGNTIEFELTCHIRKNCSLKPWQREEGTDQEIWAVIPNKAAVAFQWTNGQPARVEKETEEVRIRLKETHIRLTKEIQAKDIVWAHGNPIFTFKVWGKDVDGISHTWYQTLEFTKQNTGWSAGSGGGWDTAQPAGKVRLTADFTVPAGTFFAEEEKTMRYHPDTIYDVVGGAARENGVEFTLADGRDGAAVFFNAKSTDEDESHTAFVRNQIGSGNE